MGKKNVFKKDRGASRTSSSKGTSKVDEVITEHATREVELAKVRTDGDTQSRMQMDEDTIAQYSERMELNEASDMLVDLEGRAWPALEIIEDDEGELWLVDGFHRRAAAERAGFLHMQALIKPGTKRDALRLSFGVNATHGKRRTRRDLQRNIKRALRDEVWGTWSDSRIARMCHTTQPTVSKHRAALEAKGVIPFHEVLLGKDDYEHVRTLPPEEVEAPSRSKKEVAAPSKPRSEKKASSPSWQQSLASLAPGSLDALVIYPGGAGEVVHIAEHAPRVLKDAGVLVVPIAGGQEGLLDGLMALCAQTGGPFSPPQPVYIKSFGRLFWVYGDPEILDNISLELPNPAGLFELLPGSKRSVLGDALESW